MKILITLIFILAQGFTSIELKATLEDIQSLRVDGKFAYYYRTGQPVEKIAINSQKYSEFWCDSFENKIFIARGVDFEKYFDT